MANVQYASCRGGMKSGEIIWTTGVFRCQLWRNAPFVPTHRTVQQLADAGGVLVASSDPLVTSVTAYGAADAEDVLFPSIAEGPVLTAMTIAQVSAPTGGAELPTDAQLLVGFINRARMRGTQTSDGALSIPPNGRPVKVIWSDTAARIFT